MLHPSDIELWNRTEKLAWALDKQFDLNLNSVEPKKRPTGETLGLCAVHLCQIWVLVREKEAEVDGGRWAPQPRPWEDIRNTVCHELAHIRHADHGEGFAKLHAEILAAAIELETLTAREQIISRVRKLRAKAESAAAIDQVQESQAFAEKVAALMTQYKLSVADLEDNEYKHEEIGTQEVEGSIDGKKKRRRTYWIQRLASLVAGSYSCRLLIIEGSSKLIFVGRESDRTVAINVFEMLRNAIGREAQARYDAIFRPGMPRGFMESFRKGAIDALATRFELQRMSQEVEANPQAYALMIREPDREVEDWVNFRYKRGSSGLTGRYGSNNQARQEGNNYGSSIAINPALS